MKNSDLNENSQKENKNDINENNEKNSIKEVDKEQGNITNDSDNNKNTINTISEDSQKPLMKDKNGDDKKKYLLLIKEKLNNEKNVQKYMETIKNNPEKLFEIINDRTIMFWQSVVYDLEATLIDTDSDILTAVPERKDQQIIINDARRTRFRESSLIPGFQKILEGFLTFYCNSKKIGYKQGLNEIFGPLILMQYKIKNLKLANIFNFGEAFIDKFLPNYYYEKEVYSLKSSISLFVLLLKYHEPSVYNYLDSIEIPHELYAANWLLTLRAQKLNLDILYFLLDYLMKINDPLFIDFILVAIIKINRELLINCDSNLLLKLIVGLTINSKEELDEIIKIALELRDNTPYSYRILSNRFGFLKTNNQNISKSFNKYKPESITTMQIFPSEILYENYKNKIICPDPKCKNNLKNQNIISNVNNHHICEKCDMKLGKKLNYIILDLRLFTPSFFKDDYDFFKMGFVSGMMAIDREELKSDRIDKILTNRLLSLRGKSHFILMTSKTDYFSDFEQKFYADERSDIMKRKILFGVIEAQKEEKKLNLEDAERNLDLKEIYKLKEYDNLRNLIIEMKKNNFPYVSYLEGGFEELHAESLKYKIELVDHNKKKCKLCKKQKESKEEKEYKKLDTEAKIINISDTLWKNKKTITEKELNSLFSNEKNVVIVCSLYKYKNKYYHRGDIEIFVAVLFDKKIIEIYKNDFKCNNSNNEMNNKDNINYYNLGIKEDKKNSNFVLTLYENIQFDDIEKAASKNKLKNRIVLTINNKEDDKKKLKPYDNYEIGFDFYSIEDCKTFINLIRKIKKQDNFNLFKANNK